MPRWLVLVALCGLGAAACGGGVEEDAAPQDVLFSDDFTDDRHGWAEELERLSGEVTGGELVVTNDEDFEPEIGDGTDLELPLSPTEGAPPIDDVTLTATFRWTDFPIASAGFLCKRSGDADSSNYYALFFDPVSGSGEIRRYEDVGLDPPGFASFLVASTDSVDQFQGQETEPRELEATCRQDLGGEVILRLSVDGEVLIEGTDTGDLGLNSEEPLSGDQIGIVANSALAVDDLRATLALG